MRFPDPQFRREHRDGGPHVATINEHYAKLGAGYLFPEIAKRMQEFLKKNPGAEVMRLGIGDTTEALTPAIVAGLHKGVDQLANAATYTGYGEYQGEDWIREALAKRYESYGVALDQDEIFVSDGAKCDAANIQSIFAQDNVVAVQDPAYPVYVDSNVISGRTGTEKNGQFDGLVYMPCTEENGFFPALPEQHVDIIYICSPNNPTGAVATLSQLKVFVDYAREHKAIILFDAAYAVFIADRRLPMSIYEVEGAKDCAIEIGSFSKEAGFTGLRLGWSVVPKALRCEDGEPGRLHGMWERRQTTMFNGPSNIVQHGGLAVLSEQGQKESQELVAYYMANAQKIRDGLERLGLTCYGGENAPYVWMKTPNAMPSWDCFDKLLTEAHVVTTPGAGFGPSGEGFVRFSAFGHTESIERAVKSIQANFSM